METTNLSNFCGERGDEPRAICTPNATLIYPEGDCDRVEILGVDGDINDDTTAEVRLPNGRITTVMTLDLVPDTDDDDETDEWTPPFETKDDLFVGQRVLLTERGLREVNASTRRTYVALGFKAIEAPQYNRAAIFFVTDLFERPTFTKPDFIGVRLPDKNLSVSVRITDIAEEI